MTLSVLLDQYISDEIPRRKRASTVKLHTGQIERYIRPHLGAMAVADVTREDVRNLHRRTTDTGCCPCAGRTSISSVASGASKLRPPNRTATTTFP